MHFTNEEKLLGTVALLLHVGHLLHGWSGAVALAVHTLSHSMFSQECTPMNLMRKGQHLSVQTSSSIVAC